MVLNLLIMDDFHLYSYAIRIGSVYAMGSLASAITIFMGCTSVGWGRNIEADSYEKEPCKVEDIGNPFWYLCLACNAHEASGFKSLSNNISAE
jgi:hypothetical protein